MGLLEKTWTVIKKFIIFWIILAIIVFLYEPGYVLLFFALSIFCLVIAVIVAIFGGAEIAAVAAEATEATEALGTAGKIAGVSEVGTLGRILSLFGKQPAPNVSLPINNPGNHPQTTGKLPIIAILALGGVAVFFLLNTIGLTAIFSLPILIGLGIAVLFLFTNPAAARDIFSVIILVAIGFVALIIATRVNLPPQFLLIFLLIYFITLLFLKTPGKIALLLNLLILIPLFTTNIGSTLFKPNSPISDSIFAQKKALRHLSESGTTLLHGAQADFQKQMLIATGDYEQSVEAEGQQKLGVFLEQVVAVPEKVPLDGKIRAHAYLSATTFKPSQPLTITTACNSERLPGKIKQNEFTTFQKEDVTCDFDAKDLGAGEHPITLSATFDFSTSAFLKTYFMNQDDIVAYLSAHSAEQTPSPLDDFGITDKKPTSVFSKGPLFIGMNVGDQPVALSTENIGPTLSITLDKNWQEGKLKSINQLTLHAPSGVSFEDINGYSLDRLCTKPTNTEQICQIPPELLQKIIPDTIPTHLYATTKILSSGAVLQNKPLAITSFKIDAQYTYQIEKTTSVIVLSPQKVTP